VICSKVTKNLSALIDRMLTPQEEAIVNKHLQGCARCREELTNLQTIVRNVQTLGAVDPPDDFKQGLHVRLVKLQGIKPQARISDKQRYQPLISVAAAIFIIAMLSLNAAYPDFLLSLSTSMTSPAGTGTVALSPGIPPENYQSDSTKVKGPDPVSPNTKDPEGMSGSVLPDANAAGYPVQGRGGGGSSSQTEQTQDDQRLSSFNELSGEQATLAKPFHSFVVHEAQLKLQITDTAQVKGAVSKLAVDHQGYLEDAILAGSKQAVPGECALTVRIPKEEFDSVLAQLVMMGQVLDKKVKTEDIGKEVEGVNVKLQAQKAEEKQLVQQTLSSNCPELQNQLQQIQSDIVATTNQLIDLNQRVNSATINLSLIQE